MTQNLQDIKKINKILGEFTSGTLNDSNIIKLCEQHKILIEEDYQREKVKQCCYELRASDKYIILSGDENSKEYSIDIDKEDYILIKPHNQVVIITQEKLNIPDNIVGRIMTKGKLFSVGLIPVNTYADPGFKGQLGIVFSNISNNYIKIKHLDSIAKIEFSKIIAPVNRTYTGQHGYETGIWPIPNGNILSKSEMKNNPKIFDSELDELESIYGKMIGSQFKKVYKYQRGVMVAFTIYVIINFFLFLFIDRDSISHFLNIIIGIITNIIWALIWKFVESR